MKRVARYALLAAVFAAFALPTFAGGKATVKVINQSKWEIHHVFISPTEQEEWGPDQIGENVLGKGQSFTIHSIPCDTYDIKVVDEDGDECIIEAVELCGQNAYWKITDKDLLECEGYE
jgi:hypothetical protein